MSEENVLHLMRANDDRCAIKYCLQYPTTRGRRAKKGHDGLLMRATYTYNIIICVHIDGRYSRPLWMGFIAAAFAELNEHAPDRYIQPDERPSSNAGRIKGLSQVAFLIA